jgi:hypothetical protein
MAGRFRLAGRGGRSDLVRGGWEGVPKPEALDAFGERGRAGPRTDQGMRRARAGRVAGAVVRIQIGRGLVVSVVLGFLG